MTDTLHISDDMGDQIDFLNEGDTINISPQADPDEVSSYQISVNRVREIRDFFNKFLAANGDESATTGTTIIVNQFIFASPGDMGLTVDPTPTFAEAPQPRTIQQAAKEALETGRPLSFFYTSRGDAAPSFRQIEVRKVTDRGIEGSYIGDPDEYRNFLYTRIAPESGFYVARD